VASEVDAREADGDEISDEGGHGRPLQPEANIIASKKGPNHLAIGRAFVR
jgi:hypothetical protein